MKIKLILNKKRLLLGRRDIEVFVPLVVGAALPLQLLVVEPLRTGLESPIKVRYKLRILEIGFINTVCS